MNIFFKKLKKQSLTFYVLCIFILSLILYTSSLFIYLKIVGVYGVAKITEYKVTSEGVDYTYTFLFNKTVYNGSFTGIGNHKKGDLYFVLFSQDNPNRSLLQYNNPAPKCFQDSLNKYWIKLPN